MCELGHLFRFCAGIDFLLDMLCTKLSQCWAVSTVSLRSLSYKACAVSTCSECDEPVALRCACSLQEACLAHPRHVRALGVQEGCEAVPGGGQFRAVLMDFGSTREAAVDVHSRTEALAVQEDADAHCRRACTAAPARPQ